MASKFAPSAAFLNQIKAAGNSGVKLELVDRILKEIELITYFHSRCPEQLTDRDWNKLLKTRNVADRVTLLEYIAVTQHREALDVAKKEESKRKFEELMSIQRAHFEAGGMGYGTNLHQLLINPLRFEKGVNLIEGAKKYKTIRLGDSPKIGIDCQFFPSMPIKEVSKMGGQVSMVMNENEVSRNSPFDIELLNLNEKRPEIADVVEVYMKYLKQKYAHQRILPDVYDHMPYKMGDRQVFYVTRKAWKMFDRPIGEYRNIIIPATFDRLDESLIYCQKMKFTPIYFPIRKFVKWESGHFYLPLPNMMRLFSQVAQNGGDWGAAIGSNVAQRHKLTIDQRREKLGGLYDKQYHERQERRDLVKMIDDAMQKLAPMKGQKLDTSVGGSTGKRIKSTSFVGKPP